MMDEIRAAFDRLHSQLDAFRVELGSCCQRIGHIERELAGSDYHVAALKIPNRDLI